MCADVQEGSQVYRLGVVSYLNAKPLIAGLDRDPRMHLVLDVPARLPALLDAGDVDAALVPVIDLVQPGRRWKIISDACIGCDGETLTVRVFSRVPAKDVRILHVDGDSHTSVALARIVWREVYGHSLKVRRFNGSETVGDCEAVLLIGDKVVTRRLIDYGVEVDLGAAWKTLTGLPFVFAVWAATEGTETAVLDEALSAARDRGERSAAMIAEDFAPGMGWPVALARRYLTVRIRYRLGAAQRQGMDRFLALVREHQLIPSAGPAAKV